MTKGTSMTNKDRLIVALDLHTMEDVRRMVDTLADSVSYYKVGMELFYSVGPTAVDFLKESGKKVFLDLKVHDIPNTAAGAVASLADLGADMMNVHAGGGFTMMRRAAEALRESAAKAGVPCPKLIAVTVLTGIDQTEWEELGQTGNIKGQILRLAKLAQKAELDGVVASPQEAAIIRENCGKDFLVVTPGVRPQGADKGDQSRIATPAAAIQNGASHIVVGRPIIKNADPRGAAQEILRQMEEVL